MGTMVSVRGWLQCDDAQLARIKEIVAADDPERTYSGGWAFPARQYNNVSWAFYGGDIRAASLDWFEESCARSPSSRPPAGTTSTTRGPGDCSWSATTSTA